ncbi:MAG: membrane protein insertase YidC [Cyclobacteriaceae bacterium]
MDRNSAIGLTLIAALLLAYFYWFSPKPQPQATAPVTTESPSQSVPDSAAQQDVVADSLLASSYGDFSSFARGAEKTTAVETEDLSIIFTSKGGVIKELELKKYKTYSQKPLKLVTPDRTDFELLTNYEGREVDLYSLYYNSTKSQQGDTTVVSFSLQLSDGSSLKHIYSVPNKGYQIKYHIEQKGMGEKLSGNHLTFEWTDDIGPMEKDIRDTRNNSTVTYYEVNDGFDRLSEASSGTELETFSGPLKWVAIKKKFFLASIIAEDPFSGGEVSTLTNDADTAVVEHARMTLFIPRTSIIAGADFRFYIGPNDYQEIDVVAPDFERNVYLGWPPIFWINKFLIFPVFHFLTGFISNYGLIIIILVILLKLVLAPLSYRSFLSMAKMKVLKPELDEIKEKHGDDSQKVQQEQLKLYQQVGVNPISGCIPVLLSMPLIFAMFYLFPASIELRQQPFLWAEDLSTYDSPIRLPFEIPFGVGSHISLFTLLMTISTLIYQWQNNQLSNIQGPMKSMGYIMPIIFLFFLNSFSSGLTFYYFVSNLVTFAQQAIIRRFVDEKKIKAILEENRKKIAAGAGKKSKFMSKLEEAMKASEETRRKAEEDKKKRKKK